MKLSDRINTKQLKYAARNLSVLAHPARIEIIKMLLGTVEMNVTQIQEKLNLTQPETSHHLQLLKDYCLVKKVRRGKSSFYAVYTDLLAKIIEISVDLYHSK
jgi:ArsR family transcriptional regulator, zinc-responsive transcriptional repressor